MKINLDKDGDGVNEDMDDDGIFSNQKLRYALAYSINREEITLALMHGEISATTLIPDVFIDDTGSDFFDSSTTVLKTDDANYARAVTLFEEAASELRYSFTELQAALEAEEFIYSNSLNNELIVTMIQDMWRNNLGFEIQVTSQDFGTYYTTLHSGDFLITISSQVSDYPHPYGYLKNFLSTYNQNYGNYVNDDYDTFLEEFKSTDMDVQYDKLKQANQELMNDMPFIPVFHYTDSILISTELKGWTQSVRGPLDLTYAYFEESE